MVSGTLLDEQEDVGSDRVREALGPWRVSSWHTTYAERGAAAVDALPGGADWRSALENLAPDGERHLLTFEGHVTHLTDRDRPVLNHIDLRTMVGDAASIARKLESLAGAGFAEVIYTPSGPDVVRELGAFADAHAIATRRA